MNSATGLPMAESGNGWTYSGGKLTLTSGEWNFSYTHPANGAGETLSEVKCIVQINEGATVTGGTFTKVVNNGVNDRENNIRVKGGTIEGGKFDCNVYNYGGTIKAGEFTHCWNDNLDDAKGTIEGGTFDSNGMSASVTNYGIISGGTFNDLVTSDWKGVIENGTFNGKVNNEGSIDGGYFLSADNTYDTDSKVSGGVFKTIPSKVEDTSNLYKIQFDSECGAETTNTLSVDNHDFGMTSVYVVGTDDTELTVTAKDKILTSVNNKANTTANSNSITFKLGEVKLADEKDGNAYLLKLNAKLYNSELKIGADGKPVTENRKPYGDGVQGNGWTYNTKTDTLTILTGHTERFAEFDVNNILKVNVVVQKGATVERGWFYKTVENHGTMSQAYFCGNVTNTGDGTMKKCTFLDSNFTGNLTITNEGEMEECIVMKDVTMLTNNGKMIRSSVGAETVQGDGTYDTCLLAKNYEIAGTHKVTTKNETDKIDVRLVNSDGNECYTEGEETKVYFTGTPTLKVQIRRYDDGHMARIPLTNVNGDENYGIIPLENNFYIFAVSAEGDVILNDTVKHTLTLQFAEIVNDDGTTPISGTYVEGEKIRIRPNFGTDSEKVFDGWMSEDINVNTEIVYDAETNTYILTMPGKNATVDAKYKDKAPTTYTLTVVDGQSSTGKTSEELKEGKEVAVDANVPDDKVFTGWTASDGVTLTHNGKEVDLSENHLVFNMPAKTFTLTANFETARTNILFNEDGTLNLDGVKDYEGDGWWYDEDENVLYLEPQTETKYNFTHVNPQEDTSAELKEVNVVVWVNNNNAHIVGGTFAKKVRGNAADASIQNCTFKSEVNTNTPVKNCIFTKSSTITDIYIAENCLFEEKQDESKIAAKELTEESGATITATFDGCAGEISGETLYFTGTPTLKVKVAGGIVEKANNKPVGDADANGWYTVTAAEDDEQIVLTKGEKTTPDPVDPNPTPNPDDQPKTYTVTTDSYGKVNGGASATVKENDWVHMTVAEVPEGMTFDYWDIPDALLKALQKQNSGFRNNVENLNFQMPNMGEEEQTFAIKANFRSSELPGEDDGPSALGTMATVAVGGAAAGILVWQGVSLGVDSYLQLNLPQGVAVPTNRRELVVLLWKTAGKPETALPSLYSDLPAEEIELQKATRWAIDNGLVKPADDSDASRFDPDRYVTKYDVFGAWLKLKKLMK